jgi:hypothetical protein
MYPFISQRPSRTCFFKYFEQEGGGTPDVAKLFERGGTVDMTAAIVDDIGDRFMDRYSTIETIARVPN